MSTAPRRPTVRLHDVSVSGTDGSDGTGPDSLVAAVRAAVAAAAADGTPTREGVRSAVTGAVTSAVNPPVTPRSGGNRP